MAMHDSVVPARLTVSQLAYLKALASTLADGEYPAIEIARLASGVHHGGCKERRLLQRVVRPLERAGYLAVQLVSDRGGASRTVPVVAPTERLAREHVDPFLARLEGELGGDLCRLLHTPLGEIVSRARSPDPQSRALALQALAVRLMALVDPAYDQVRVHARAAEEAAAELLFESRSLLLPRWQVRCTSSDPVVVDDVATEVGLTYLVHGDVVVLVGTGRIGPGARRYAHEAMQSLRLPVLLVDGTDLERLAAAPSAILRVLKRQSRLALART